MIEIRSAEDPASLTAARALVRAHIRDLGASLTDADLDRVLAALPAPYVAPGGALWVAWDGNDACGCLALHGLDSEVAELKRMYVRREARGRGVARKLVEHAISAATERGYKQLRLGTLPDMHAAQRLYTRLGFRPIPPYRAVEFGQTLFYELTLGSVAGA